MNILVTGGCGFIASNLIEFILESNFPEVERVINLDIVTYAGNMENTKTFADHDKYIFEKVNLSDTASLYSVFSRHNITHVIHLAAESHVDNAIASPDAFMKSNIIGTHNLLKLARQFGVKRFHHVSTDEVYGELGDTGKFDEETPYDPRNPYSASKAASDFIVRSYFHTYNFPVTLSNCCNNYGPRQHDEKLIPTVIRSISQGKKIPVYGEGLNVRDWIYVKDHCEGIWKVFTEGTLGETYCIGSNCERRNIDLIHVLCDAMNVNPEESIEYVTDRAGHDFRYAIDNKKIVEKLGWTPKTSFEEGLKQTVEWYNEKY
jgi:dTDP-glucose 4,6-dehydratase